MSNSIFEKTMENVKKHKKLRKNYLMSEPNYHTTKDCPDNFLAIEMKRIWILMNKPVYLGLSMLEIIKMVMYEF